MAGKIKEAEYYENPIITKSGEERLIEWHNTVIHEEGGKIIGTLSSGEDITERKKAEEMRLQLAAIVDSADDGIIGASLDATITAWNKGAEHIYGYSANEIIGKPVNMLVPENKIPEMLYIFEKLKHGEGSKIMKPCVNTKMDD